MSVVTKALYLNYINRIEKSEKVSKSFAALGKKDAANRWKKNNTANSERHGDANDDANGEAIEKHVWPPTPTPSPTPSLIKETRGDTPMPPACVDDKKVMRFVKPTEQEVLIFVARKAM